MHTEKNLQENFFVYLKERGYKEFTPSGKPSTIYDYVNRIDRVCKSEELTWTELSLQINKIVMDYDIGGCKEEIGKKSHSAVINALKRYREFIGQVG